MDGVYIDELSKLRPVLPVQAVDIGPIDFGEAGPRHGDLLLMPRVGDGGALLRDVGL